MPIDFGLFVWKNKAEREEEQAVYGEWAFPYGPQQKESIEDLLRALFPKGDVVYNLIKYLTCRELYEKELKTAKNQDAAADRMINHVRKFRNVLKESEMPVYLAIVLADAAIDENLEYPSANVIRAYEAELRLLRNK